MPNKPLEFPFGFYVNDNTPDSGKYFNRLTGRPYLNMITATTLLPIGVRYEGLVINIAGIEYWWPSDTNDLSLDPIIREYGAGSFADLDGDPYDNTALSAALNNKLDKQQGVTTDIQFYKKNPNGTQGMINFPSPITKSVLGIDASGTTFVNRPFDENTLSNSTSNIPSSKAVTDNLVLKLDRNISNISGTTAGTNIAYTLTLSPALPSLISGQIVFFKPNITNGTAATLNVSATGAKPLVNIDGTALAASTLNITKYYMVVYDGTNWQMLYVMDGNAIKNGTAAQIASFYITLTGRIDGGLGLGMTPSVGARLSVAANTSTIAQLLLTPSTTDYTGSTSGTAWINTGEFKILLSSIVNRLLKVYDNELFKSNGNYIAMFNQFGDLSASIKVDEGYIYNEDAIDELLDISGWEAGNNSKTITTGLVLQGQYYYSSINKYFYFCPDDDLAIRMPIRNHRSCTKTITIASTGSTFQDDDLIGASEVHFIIMGGAILQNDGSSYTFNGTTGTVNLAVTSGDMITFTYT